MDNFNFYKEEIERITKEGKTLALYDEVPAVCGARDCRECHFNNYNEVCENGMLRWLLEEHIEKPKLSKEERLFCEIVKTGWIARDENGILLLFSQIAIKGENCWYPPKTGSYLILNTYPFSCLEFDFIRWEDADPWAVEDLLKLKTRE